MLKAYIIKIILKGNAKYFGNKMRSMVSCDVLQISNVLKRYFFRRVLSNVVRDAVDAVGGCLRSIVLFLAGKRRTCVCEQLIHNLDEKFRAF